MMKDKKAKLSGREESKEDKNYFLITILIVIGTVIGISLFFTYVVMSQ